jgi:hypothetical protein
MTNIEKYIAWLQQEKANAHYKLEQALVQVELHRARAFALSDAIDVAEQMLKEAQTPKPKTFSA